RRARRGPGSPARIGAGPTPAGSSPGAVARGNGSPDLPPPGGRARAMHAQSHLLTPADQPQRLGELDLTRLDELRERRLVLSAASEAGGQARQGALRDPADGRLVRAQRFRGQWRRDLTMDQLHLAAAE